MEEAAKALSKEYGCSVLIKGGHSIEDACDVLFDKGQVSWFETTKIDNPNTHGTGCTLSSAIASNLALGFDLKESVKNAKEYITSTISDGLDLGKGHGPLNHMVGLIREKGDADGSNKRERLCSGR